ncbi:MAG: serine/threonine-protein phosphatase [Eubacterium sp.]|nr:serine/threonine-protein phosphatase [Eubacterium sp.]
MEDYSNDVTQQLSQEESQRLISDQGTMGDYSRYEMYGSMSSVLGTRENQQDSCYVNITDQTYAVGIVCDGMGGLAGGEIASQSAVKMFIEDFEEIRYSQQNFCDFFRSEMIDIDTMVANLKDEYGDYLHAGTTLVAVSVTDGYLQWISVGDSKIYIIRGDDMVCVTKEHNYFLLLNEQLAEGQISEEEYNWEAKRGEALISYLGMGNVSLMDFNPNPLKLRDGDILLLCSDGLYKALSEDQIYSIIRKNPVNIEKTLQELQEEAHLASPRVQDNTSIVMLLYRE